MFICLDTVAAIAGSILGARFGTKWIPVDRILDFDRLVKYANSLITRNASEVEDMNAFMDKEKHWAEVSDKFRKELMSKYFPSAEPNRSLQSKPKPKSAAPKQVDAKHHIPSTDAFVYYYLTLKS